jgi:hypothetical protein
MPLTESEAVAIGNSELTTEGWTMAIKQIVCSSHENVFQAFARAVRTGALPSNAKLFPLAIGIPEPEAPAGYVTVATVVIRPRESFAVGVPCLIPPSIAQVPPSAYETGRPESD